MVSPLVSRAPQCLSCVRRMAGSLGNGFHRQQVRGKKRKAPKIETVNVQLLKDMAGYGAKGAVTSVNKGRMRNIWYPEKIARYLTEEMMKQLQVKRNVVVPRDFTAKSEEDNHRDIEETELKKIAEKEERERLKLEEEQKAAEEAARPKVEEYQFAQINTPQQRVSVPLHLLSPSEATQILESQAPPFLDFYPPTMTTSIASRHSLLSGMSQSGDEPGPQPNPDRVGIYGSITKEEVALNLKTVLSADPQGARVLFSAKNITFVDDLPEKDRIKYLGVYDIDILLDGATKPIRRSVRVQAGD